MKGGNCLLFLLLNLIKKLSDADPSSSISTFIGQQLDAQEISFNLKPKEKRTSFDPPDATPAPTLESIPPGLCKMGVHRSVQIRRKVPSWKTTLDRDSKP